MAGSGWVHHFAQDRPEGLACSMAKQLLPAPTRTVGEYSWLLMSAFCREHKVSRKHSLHRGSSGIRYSASRCCIAHNAPGLYRSNYRSVFSQQIAYGSYGDGQASSCPRPDHPLPRFPGLLRGLRSRCVPRTSHPAVADFPDPRGQSSSSTSRVDQTPPKPPQTPGEPSWRRTPVV